MFPRWNLIQRLNLQKYKCIILHQRKKYRSNPSVHLTFSFRGTEVFTNAQIRQQVEKASHCLAQQNHCQHKQKKKAEDLFHDLVFLILEFIYFYLIFFLFYLNLKAGHPHVLLKSWIYNFKHLHIQMCGSGVKMLTLFLLMVSIVKLLILQCTDVVENMCVTHTHTPNARLLRKLFYIAHVTGLTVQ